MNVWVAGAPGYANFEGEIVFEAEVDGEELIVVHTTEGHFAVVPVEYVVGI